MAATTKTKRGKKSQYYKAQQERRRLLTFRVPGKRYLTVSPNDLTWLIPAPQVLSRGSFTITGISWTEELDSILKDIYLPAVQEALNKPYDSPPFRLMGQK